MIRSSLIVLFLAISTRSFSCFNYYYSLDKKGYAHGTGHYHGLFATSFNNSALEADLRVLSEKLKHSTDYKLLSDYAVLLLKAGKTQAGLEILMQLQKEHPQEYALASNLGTAYELTNDLENALKFIRLGLKLNPDSHEGSEWIHVAILETKVTLSKNPAYLNKGTVLKLSPAQESSKKVRDQLLLQLQERFPFIPKGDIVMADLLVDLGDCFAETVSYEHAKAFYRLAQRYHGDDRSSTEAKVKAMLKLREKYVNTEGDFSRDTDNKSDDTPHMTLEKNMGTPHENLLETPVKSEINWKGIRTGSEELLAGIDHPESAAVADTSAQSSEAATQSKPSRRTTKDELQITGLVVICLVVLILILVFLRRRRDD